MNTDLAPGAVDLPPKVAHSIYAYTKYKCRCDICRAAKAVIVRNYRDRAGITKFAPPRVKQPRKQQPRQPVGGTISKARELRILSLTKPVLEPTFVPTPVDDCGEFIARGVYCRRPFPCTEHGGDQ